MTAPAAGQPAMLAAALRAGAARLYCAEAGAGLLIGQGAGLRRGDFTGPFIAVTPGLAGRAAVAVIGRDAAVAALDGGALPCGSGERRILHLAASIAAGMPADPGEALTGPGRPASRRRPGPSRTPGGTGTRRSPCRRASRLTCGERANDEVEPAAGRRPPRHLDGQ